MANNQASADHLQSTEPAEGFEAWLARYVGEQDPGCMRFSLDELQNAYVSGQRDALGALDATKPHHPIMLEMVAASAVHDVWEGRWRTLSKTVAKDRLIRDAYGSYGVADFIEYAGQACGFGK